MKRTAISALILIGLVLSACGTPAPASIPGQNVGPSPSQETPAPPQPAPVSSEATPSPQASTIPAETPLTPSITAKSQETAPPVSETPPSDSSTRPEEKPATAPTPPPEMPRGAPDPNLVVERNQSEKTWPGTTILADNHDLTRPRIIEVNMLGEIVWQYQVPQELVRYTNPGFDVEPLPNNNVLFVLPGYGVFEVDRQGKTVWSYRDSKVSHDADRLANGNTLVVFGGYDQKEDAQVKEISQEGKVVWSWYARDHFDVPPYTEINREGWTHTNAASRLSNGNTLISLRNFNIVAEVDSKGAVVRKIGEGMLSYQHDPEVLANGNILMADHSEPQRAIELDPETNRIVWQFPMPRQLVRDANRLPNGNTLITGSTTIVEVTGDGKICWQLSLKGVFIGKEEAPARGFYKAERISAW